MSPLKRKDKLDMVTLNTYTFFLCLQGSRPGAWCTFNGSQESVYPLQALEDPSGRSDVRQWQRACAVLHVVRSQLLKQSVIPKIVTSLIIKCTSRITARHLSSSLITLNTAFYYILEEPSIFQVTGLLTEKQRVLG